jgi:hypothetical protein
MSPISGMTTPGTGALSYPLSNGLTVDIAISRHF